MAVLSKEEMIKKLSEKFGDDNSDDVLSILEDITDTYASWNDAEDWKTKYEENDSAWRKKYRDRFENNELIENIQDYSKVEDEVKTFEDLFK